MVSYKALNTGAKELSRLFCNPESTMYAFGFLILSPLNPNRSLGQNRKWKPHDWDKERRASFWKGYNCRFLSFLKGNSYIYQAGKNARSGKFNNPNARPAVLSALKTQNGHCFQMQHYKYRLVLS